MQIDLIGYLNKLKPKLAIHLKNSTSNIFYNFFSRANLSQESSIQFFILYMIDLITLTYL